MGKGLVLYRPFLFLFFPILLFKKSLEKFRVKSTGEPWSFYLQDSLNNLPSIFEEHLFRFVVDLAYIDPWNHFITGIVSPIPFQQQLPFVFSVVQIFDPLSEQGVNCNIDFCLFRGPNLDGDLTCKWVWIDREQVRVMIDR